VSLWQRYEEARANIQTGDIVLFSGKGGISSAIKWFTRSGWSHVGMALRVEEFDTVLLWESTTLSDIADIESGRQTRGVQLVTLSERLMRYKGDVAIRHLDAARTPERLGSLRAFRAEARGRPYEESALEMIRAAYDLWGGSNREDLSSLFCSELIAEAYQRMGLLCEDKPSNEYTPADFAAITILGGGATLGNLVHISPISPSGGV